MKIKNQFRLFIAGIVAIPLIAIISLPVYDYVTSPARMLTHPFKGSDNIKSRSFSDGEMNDLYKRIAHSPPDVQTAVVKDMDYVLFSSIPEMKEGAQWTDEDMLSLISDTSGAYFYQLVPIPSSDDGTLIVVTRGTRDPAKKRYPMQKFLLSVAPFFIAFELFCIIITILISNTVSSSITILEERTRKVASGDLDTEIKHDTKRRGSNEITLLTENLEKMRLSLKEDRDRRSRFIMGISHDLRTPVAVIKGYTEAITDGVASDPAAIKNALDIISSKTSSLEEMIETLINFEKLSNGEWKGALKAQPLSPFIQEFASGCESVGAVFKRNVSSHVDIPNSVKVPFDSQLFRRALENIFSNAIRYSNEGDSITIEAKQNENGVVSISIKDTGQGIAEEHLAHIFDMFYRGTSSRREHGMGIGLSVVKSVIDAHGWNIEVSSHEGDGTAFTITIPAVQSGRA